MDYRKKLAVFCGICLLSVFCSIFLSACFDYTSTCNGSDTNCNNVGNNNPASVAVTATQSSIDSEFIAITKTTPVLVDPLTQQDNNQWDTDSESGGYSCSFQDQTYVVLAPNSGDENGNVCSAEALHFGDAAVQIDVTLTDGTTGGLVFREQFVDGVGEFYYFYVTTDGQFGLDVYKASSGGPVFSSTLISMTSNDAIVGASQRNQLLVIMKGPSLILFDNGAYLDQISDNTYTSGTVGAFVINNSSTNPNGSSFDNLVVYKD